MMNPKLATCCHASVLSKGRRKWVTYFGDCERVVTP